MTVGVHHSAGMGAASRLSFDLRRFALLRGDWEKRGGVILGDVAGLGRGRPIVTVLAPVFQDPPRLLESLIRQLKNLAGLWKDYARAAGPALD